MMRTIACAIVFLAISVSPLLAQENQKHAAVRPLTVDFIDAQSQSVGTATLSEAAQGVKIVISVKNLPPGPHLMHIHAFPKCEPPDFKSAGPHFNPTGGQLPKGVMAGDIPNFVLTVSADGTAHVTTVAPNVTLGTDVYSLFSNGGTSLVIHAVASEVSASAPPRIACAVVTKPE